MVGLGPAGADLVTPAVRAAVASIPVRFVRTSRHPSSRLVQPATSFDELYEGAEGFEDLYVRIAGRLAEAAMSHGEILYAVPGSPLVGERTVELLRSRNDVEVDLVAGMSFLDLAWGRLGLDPLAEAVHLVDASSFAIEASGERGPFLVAQCWSPGLLSEVKLLLGAGVAGARTPEVTVLQRLGLPGERVETMPWHELDRRVVPDHLTSVFVPRMDEPVGAEVARLQELVATLRQRCPWDRRQTHRSLVRHLVEETYEVVEAIESLDESPASYGHLEEELGDLLFQVCFHSQLATEEGQFGLPEVARAVRTKLVSRHPHVFGDLQAATAEEVAANWERIKKAEKGRRSLMDGIPAALPSLLAATKVIRKAASVGVDISGSLPPPAPAARRGAALPGGPPAGTEEQVGEWLLWVVGLATKSGIDAEAALRRSTAAARARFERAEELAASRGTEIAGLPEGDAGALWREAGAAGMTKP